jgi:hypothetical protein
MNISEIIFAFTVKLVFSGHLKTKVKGPNKTIDRLFKIFNSCLQ